jgi:hypothetical protein
LETALKKKELELRLSEATLEQSRILLNERTELIKQERQVVRFDCFFYKKKQTIAFFFYWIKE